MSDSVSTSPPAGETSVEKIAPRPWAFFVPLMAFFYALDQVTKIIVLRTMELYEFFPVIEKWFYIRYIQNTGAAWGILQGHGWFFITLSIIVFAVVLFLWLKKPEFFTGFWNTTGVLLLLPGILGNLTDRILYGYVVDFLDWHFHWPGGGYYDYPVFNVADMCIVGSAICFVTGSIFAPNDEKEREMKIAREEETMSS